MLTSTFAPWVALASCALSQLALFRFQGMPWRGEYFWSAQWIESNCFPAIIITAIAIAVDVLRTLSVDRGNLLLSGDLRAPFLTGYSVVVGTGFVIPALIGYAATAFTWNAYVGSAQTSATTHLGVSLLSMVAILAVGLVVAQLSPIAAPLLVPLSAVWLSLSAMDQSGLTLIGNSSGSLLGYRPSVTALLAQGASAAAVIVACLWLSIRWQRGQPAVSWRSIGVVTLLVGLSVSTVLKLDPYVPDDTEEAACYGDGGQGSRTCMSMQHIRLLDPLHERFTEFLEKGSDAGVAADSPHTVVEGYGPFVSGDVQPNLRVSETVVAWRASAEELAADEPEVSRESLAAAYAVPVQCQQLSANEPPSAEYDALRQSVYDSVLAATDESKPLPQRQAAARHFNRDFEKLHACRF
ncbi:MAG: hypothetical protein CSA58_12260 [Micrococcales bacterium]|nr:MAG: hypothetical protein CSA58_12260 [Micrococcales bacterium]